MHGRARPDARPQEREIMADTPSTLTELAGWIQAARKQLQGQEDWPIGGSGIVHLPVADSDTTGPSHVAATLHRPSIAYTLREQFLNHLERLYPRDWQSLYQQFRPERFRTVRPLLAMMASVEQDIERASIANTERGEENGGKNMVSRTTRWEQLKTSALNSWLVVTFLAVLAVVVSLATLGTALENLFMWMRRFIGSPWQ